MKNINDLKSPMQASVEALNNFSTMLVEVSYNQNKEMVKCTLLITEDKNVYKNGKNNLWEKFTINIPNTTENDVEKYLKFINQKVKANITKSTFWTNNENKSFPDQLSCEGTIQVISDSKQ